MKKIASKAMGVFKDNRGASNVEIIVWISVVMVIATILFAFRTTIIAFIQRAIDKVGGFEV